MYSWVKDWLGFPLTICGLFIAGYSLRLTSIRDAQVERERSQQARQHVYDAFLLGERLWETEREFIQYEDKRNTNNLPPEIAREILFSDVKETSKDLGLEITPELKELYNKIANYKAPIQGSIQEQAINEIADRISKRLGAKYPMPNGAGKPTVQEAFQVGLDAGWAQFLSKPLDDHEAAYNVRLRSHSTQDRIDISTEMTKPIEDAMTRLNNQVLAWGQTFQFGRLINGYNGPIPMPKENRTREITDFVQKIDDYLKP